MEQSKKMAKIAYEALDERKGEDIKIIDKQVVTEYDVLTTKILTTKNKTVTYTFKKNNNDNYYLSSVEVK